MDQKGTLSRYISLDKAIDLIGSKSLYFPRFDAFEDQMEGYALQQLATEWDIEIDYEDKRLKLDPSVRKLRYFGSCWFLGGEELYMWDRFRNEKAICIQVPHRSLLDRFDLKNEEHFILNPDNAITNNLKIEDLKDASISNWKQGSCTYFDENDIRERELLNGKARLGFLKHRAFENESEYRFILTTTGGVNTKVIKFIRWSIPEFDDLDISLVINPYATKYYKPMLESYVASLELRKVKVVESKFTNFF